MSRSTTAPSATGGERAAVARHDVVVVGGGNAGLSLAGKLLREGARDVAVVEPARVHHYRPMLSYVAGGQAELAELQHAQDEVGPSGARRYAGAVVAVDPRRSTVTLADGRELGYGDLALCPGSDVDWDAIPGSREAVATPAASTSYLPEHAVDVWPMLTGVRAGRVVVVVDDRHVPCAPVILKPLVMALEHWRATGVRGAIDVEVLLASETFVPLPRAEAELRAMLEEQGVALRTGVRVSAVEPRDGDGDGGTVVTVDGVRTPYDALLLAPPHRAPAWVAASGLTTSEGGFVVVDPDTLQVPGHPRIWALGDVADLDALPSGGALRQQVPVVAHNIAARRTGRAMRIYDGYSIAPVTTRAHRLLLAEFDRDGREEPTIPVGDLVRPRAASWFFDRYVEPVVYLRRLLRGKVG
ncbi:NAD(P)/FAD-dependent oxidoreductase [Litorihabitans aurantiacus]|uniref:FAD/NAD(P)-binding domain-containing protein n=1 Tax=Litorihabitans aurantiacus TaxID=1930061 RepID=A0AA37UY95_9MICO|nr:FAD/NAD(P)-binding oxidoreductase [Litorihabitans aurantiacus]GMA31342.1 hypothetical protein GCM10025875_13340 [Litorihabitans aurantiacus]